MEAWYALYTKPHAEGKVARLLKSRGFVVYFPSVRLHRDGPAEPLFPAYLFLRCDLASIGLSSLQWIAGLRRIVSFDGRPAVVPDSAIELIRAEVDRIEAAGGLPSHPFKPGDRVVIEEGPLAGLRGIFQGPVGPAERVRILLEFLGTANRAEVPVRLLRPAGEDDLRFRRRRSTRGHGRRIRYADAGDGASGAAAKGHAHG